VARCFAFAGPYLPPDGHFAFASFVRDAVLGRPIHVNGDGTPFRSYLYAMDLAVWLWTILLRGAAGRAYNVGSERALTVGQLAAEISRLLAPDSPVRISQTPVPGSRPARYVPSTRLAREELLLQEFTDREQSIIRTADWYRQTLVMDGQ
jgi:dTDP-glucose 4,6-dehydratase